MKIEFAVGGLCLLAASCAHRIEEVPRETPYTSLIRRESSRLNSQIAYDRLAWTDQGCTYLASIEHSGDAHRLSIAVGLQENFWKSGNALTEFETCDVSVEEYQSHLKVLLQEIRAQMPEVKITEFDSGFRSPLLRTFHYELALASLRDPGFKEIRRRGERSMTLNSVFDRLVSEKELFAEYIEIHRAVGLPIEYTRSEKIFRDQVKNSPVKELLLVKGAKSKDRIISGAAIYHFKVTPPFSTNGETSTSISE